MIRSVLSIVLGLLCLGTRAVQAEPSSSAAMAIVVLTSESANLLRSEVYEVGQRVLKKHTSLEVLAAITEVSEAALRRCAGRAACFVQQLDLQGDELKFLLTLSVDQPDDSLVLGLRLINIRTSRQIGAAAQEVPAGMSLDKALEESLARVIPPAYWDQIGSLHVRASVTGAQVLLQEKRCRAPCGFEQLLPGRYEVKVESNDYKPWSQVVHITPGQHLSMEAHLKTASSSVFKRPWFWLVVAGVAAAGAAGGWLIASGSGGTQEVCFARGSDDCSF